MTRATTDASPPGMKRRAAMRSLPVVGPGSPAGSVIRAAFTADLKGSLGLLALTLAGGALPVAFVWSTGAIVDDILGGALGLSIIVASGLFIAGQLLPPWQALRAELVGRRVEHWSRLRLVTASVAPATLDHLLDEEQVGSLRQATGLLAGWITLIQSVVALARLSILRVQAVLASISLALIGWWYPILLIAAWSMTRRWMRNEVELILASRRAGTDALRRASTLRDTGLTKPASKEIRVFGFLPWLMDEFSAAWTRGMGEAWERRRAGLRTGGKALLPLAVAHGIVVGVLVDAAVTRSISAAELVVALQLVIAHYAWGYLGDDEWRLGSGAAALGPAETYARLNAGVELPPPMAGVGVTALAPTVHLEGVSFRYPGRDQDALRGVTVSIDQGETVALIGENGAGKSTLISLLCGFHRPTEGRVLLAGRELDATDLSAWRAGLGVVFQGFSRFDATVAENVNLRQWGDELGETGDVPDLVLQGSQLSNLIRDGRIHLTSHLGPGFADGTDLSGGEWQRVAVARALHAVSLGARFLILDEPTAQLDPASELDLIRSLVSLPGGLTTLVVSHRLPTVRLADRIIVLEHGQITGDGTHDDLSRSNPYYAAFVEQQQVMYG